MMPGIDSHTGQIPDLRAPVAVDHTLILGAMTQAHVDMQPIRYQHEVKRGFFKKSISIPWLPRYAMGVHVAQHLTNGDFLFDDPRQRTFRRGIWG